jgi:hypothetical protein
LGDYYDGAELLGREEVMAPFNVSVGRHPYPLKGYVRTSWSNVAEIRTRSGADARVVGGKVGGILLLLVGASIAAFGTSATAQSNRVVEVGGVVLGASGLMLDAFTLWHLTGMTTDRVVYPLDGSSPSSRWAR